MDEDGGRGTMCVGVYCVYLKNFLNLLENGSFSVLSHHAYNGGDGALHLEHPKVQIRRVVDHLAVWSDERRRPSAIEIDRVHGALGDQQIGRERACCLCDFRSSFVYSKQTAIRF